MTKRIAVLLSFCCSVTIGAGIARGVELQSASVRQNSPSSAAETRQSVSIGPRDPETEKPHGIGVDVFLSKNVAMTSSVSILSPAPSMQSGQTGNGGGVGLNAAQLGATVGLKISFN